MSNRTIIIICVAFAAFVVVVFAGVGFLAFYFLASFQNLMPSPVKMPPQLAQPSVVAGEGVLQKQSFLDGLATGKVTDILFREAAEPMIGVAGLRGAVWVTPDGQVTSTVSISTGPAHVDFLDVEGDGTFEFLNRGGVGWQTASLIDASGTILWTCDRGPGVDDMAAGDLDGDGVAEFVVGYNGGGGVQMLDRNGRRKWQQPDGNVWHVEIVDTDGDGSAEIVHSNAAGQITVRDATGQVQSRAKPRPYFSSFSLCRWPTKDDPPRLLLAEDDQIWLFDFDGAKLAQFNAPNSGTHGVARGTLVEFEAGQPPHLAVLVEFRNWDRSILYVYDGDGTLDYQEVIGAACASVAAVPKHDAGTEALLVGGSGQVWEYTRPK